MTNSELTPTSAAEWRKPREEGYVVTLPSGNVARVRPVPLDMLIVRGELPDILTPIAASQLWGNDGNEEDQVAETTKYTELVNHIVSVAMLKPRICGEADRFDLSREDGDRTVIAADGKCILLEDMELNDRIAVFQLAIQPAETLRRFRDKQVGDVAALSDGEDDQPETE